MKINKYTAAELREIADAVDAMADSLPRYTSPLVAEVVADLLRWAVGDTRPTELLNLLTGGRLV